MPTYLRNMRLLWPLAAVLLILLVLAVLLEFRAYKRGFDTIVFGNQRDNNPQQVGTQDWPFRSPVPDFTSESAPEKIVWIASASHAEHKRFPVDKLFPKIL